MTGEIDPRKVPLRVRKDRLLRQDQFAFDAYRVLTRHHG